MDGPKRGPNSTAQQNIPPFWIATTENGISSVDERVLAEAEQLWPWCYGLVRQRLGDGPSAAQLLEEVSIKVSKRLWKDDRVGEHLRAYLIRAFVRRINNGAAKDNRVHYYGLSRDLEAVLPTDSPDWVREIEIRLVFEGIAACLDPSASRMLNFRRLGYSWKSIAKHSNSTEKQVRQAFYYRLKEATRVLFGPPDRPKEDLR